MATVTRRASEFSDDKEIAAFFATDQLTSRVRELADELESLDDAGRAEPNGWKIPVWRGSTHELGVDLLCDDSASASLLWSDGSSIDFADEDGDGRYTVSFTVPEIGDEVIVSLQVTCGDETIPCEMPASARDALVSGQWDFLGQLLENKPGIRATADTLPYVRSFE